MKALTIIGIFATFCTSHAQTVWGNGQNYFVYPTAGMTTVIGDRGATTIQPMAGSVNVMSTSPRVDQGALNAASLATLVAPQTALPVRTQANPPIDAVAQYKAQQDAAWAQANQTMAIALASMPPAQHCQNQPQSISEKWVKYTSNGNWIQVDPPKGLKHTKEGEALINPYTHGVEPTEQPPTNPGPWQQYLIDCKVPSNRLMRERTLLAYLDGFIVLEQYKLQNRLDKESQTSFEKAYDQLLSCMNEQQKIDIKKNLYSDFGYNQPVKISKDKLFPYVLLWVRDHPAKSVANNVSSTR
jgi:hypothetical protein